MCMIFKVWGYLTLIRLPARMPLPLMPLSRLSCLTVVWCFLASSERVSPSRMVTLCVVADVFLRFLSRLPFFFLLLFVARERVWE